LRLTGEESVRQSLIMRDLAREIRNIRPVVSVEEIRDVQRRVEVVEKLSSL